MNKIKKFNRIAAIVLSMTAAVWSTLHLCTVSSQEVPEGSHYSYVTLAVRFCYQAAAAVVFSWIVNLELIVVLRITQLSVYSAIVTTLSFHKLDVISDHNASVVLVTSVMAFAILNAITDPLHFFTRSEEILNTPVLDYAKRIFRFRRGDRPSSNIGISIPHVHEEKEVSEDDKSEGDS